MIIYNQRWLTNLVIQDEVNAFQQTAGLSSEELQAIKTAYPVGFYSPNIFIRTGLFILTCILVSGCTALLTIFVIDTPGAGISGWFMFVGIASYIILEVMVKNKHHFKSGADDALLWISSGFVLGSIIYKTSTYFSMRSDTSMILCVAPIVALMSLYLTIRFADRLTAAFCLIAILVFAGTVWYETGISGTASLSLIIIIFSGFSYFISKKSVSKPEAVFYHSCLEFLQIVSLLILYLAGNYYILKQAEVLIYHHPGQFSEGTIAPYFSWAWTILIPLVYLIAGLRSKDSILLRSGLILLTAAAYTFRSYYHVLPLEGALVLAGIILTGAAYYLIRYLKTPKHGFTNEDLQEDNLLDKVKVESLIVASMGSSTPDVPQNRFGGGNFGGGGSSGDF